MHLPNLLASLTLILLVSMVVLRVRLLRREGVAAMQFGKLDKTDFLIPPFALFYFYLVFAQTFDWPSPAHQELWRSKYPPWLGVLLCLVGLLLMIWSLVSFKTSFWVGIDTQQPGKLVTTGAFAFSRNPIYLAFTGMLLGQFLVFPNPIMLVYLLTAMGLFHRQVMREEEFLRKYYGQDFETYCKKVHRYV